MGIHDKISAKIGIKNWYMCITHDDGQFASDGGGKSTTYLSNPGKGKSTLMCQAAQQSRALEGSKKDYIKAVIAGEPLNDFQLYPETVLWRIREFDSFGSLIPENWKNSYKNWIGYIKPLHIWVHEDDYDRVIFYQWRAGSDKIREPYPVKNLPVIEVYRDALDLIAGLHYGAINAVLEPQTYKLSHSLIQLLKQRKMEMKDPDDHDDDDKAIHPDVIAHPYGKMAKKLIHNKTDRKKKKESKYENKIVKPAYFWFDLLHIATKYNKLRHIMFCLDEFHDIAPARSEDDAWKLIDILASDWANLRKTNISTHMSTHQMVYMDWRIVNRTEYIVWMLGARISPSNSMINSQSLISNLPVGKFIIEEKFQDFGITEFHRIPNSPPTIYVDGLSGTTPTLNPLQSNSIIKEYNKRGVVKA